MTSLLDIAPHASPLSYKFDKSFSLCVLNKFSDVRQSSFVTLRHAERETVDRKAPLKNARAG